MSKVSIKTRVLARCWIATRSKLKIMMSKVSIKTRVLARCWIVKARKAMMKRRRAIRMMMMTKTKLERKRRKKEEVVLIQTMKILKGRKKGLDQLPAHEVPLPLKRWKKTDRDFKRKAMVANLLDPNASNEPNAKKSRLEQFGSAGGSGSAAPGTEAITEEAVRRYLKRRPMTTTDLLKKFRSKKTGILNAQLVQLLANILKKINPHKQKVKGVTYLSLKEGQ